jgi:virulence-associated protein VapD
MELFTDVPRKNSRPVTAQVMADLIDVATALGFNSQACSIYLHDQAPDIASVRRLIDRLVRDAKEIASSIEMLQRLVASEVVAQGCKFSSATGPASQLPSSHDDSRHDIGGER